MAWKVEVQVFGDPKFYSNQLRFKTEKEARAYAIDMFMRWTNVKDYQVVWEAEEDTDE
jgi:hypothetical protein